MSYLHPVRQHARAYRARIYQILFHSDITFAVFMLGVCCVLWGVIGLMHPVDLTWYATGFALEASPWLWGLNHIGFGLALQWLAIRRMPPTASFFIGTYGIFIFTWVAMGRPNASLSSGAVFNFILIFMNGLLVHKSGQRP